MGSRRYKIGSIYSKVQNLLLKKGETNFSKPLWFDIYTHFPPEREPLFLGEPSNKKVRNIFYTEDKQRDIIQKALQSQMKPVDLTDNETESQVQQWIKLYNSYIEKGVTEEEALKILVDSQKQTGLEVTTIFSESK